MDPSRKTKPENAFKINAESQNGPLNVALCSGSMYSTVNVFAEATDAPAHLSLDSSFEGTFIAKTVESSDLESASASYAYGEIYPGHERVYRAPFQTRHIHAGAVGWGSEEAAVNARSFVEVRSIRRSAHIDL